MWVVVVIHSDTLGFSTDEDAIGVYGPFESEKAAGLWIYNFTFNVHDDPAIVKILEVV